MQAYEPNTLLLDNSLAIMGVRLPLVALTYLLHPEKKVVVICGDGGFMLNSQAGFQSFFPLGPQVKKWALEIFIA
jgi:thiamine pyrophosphate-dependent acetolactate synthase large subunit-like protein